MAEVALYGAGPEGWSYWHALFTSIGVSDSCLPPLATELSLTDQSTSGLVFALSFSMPFLTVSCFSSSFSLLSHLFLTSFSLL